MMMRLALSLILAVAGEGEAKKEETEAFVVPPEMRFFFRALERERIELGRTYQTMTGVYGLWKIVDRIDRDVLRVGRENNDVFVHGLVTDIAIGVLSDEDTLEARGGLPLGEFVEWAGWIGRLREEAVPYLMRIDRIDNFRFKVLMVMIGEDRWWYRTLGIQLNRDEQRRPPLLGWAVASIEKDGG